MNIYFTNDNLMLTLFCFFSVCGCERVCVFACFTLPLLKLSQKFSELSVQFIHSYTFCKTWNGMRMRMRMERKHINWIDAEHDEWHASKSLEHQQKVMKSGKSLCVCVYLLISIFKYNSIIYAICNKTPFMRLLSI